MSEQPIIIVKAKAINPKDKNNRSSSNKSKDNIRESFNMKDSTNQNPKITKIQENNINGNYGRIYIQEGQNKNLVYSEFSVPDSSNTDILRGDHNKNTKVNNKMNNQYQNNANKRYPNSLDKNNVNRNRGRDYKKNSSNLRRKSIDRGGNYKNIQVTHIIDSAQEIDFHITDPLVDVTEENKKKYRVKLNNYNRNGKNGKVKVVYTCSCDNVKIAPKKKKKNIGKTEVISHRENPQLKLINNYKINNTGKSYTKAQAIRNVQKYNINKRK